MLLPDVVLCLARDYKELVRVLFLLLNMNEDTTTNKAKGGRGKIQSERGLYSKLEPYADASIARLGKLIESRNEAISLGAIKIILAKLIPDKKAVELTGENNGPILIKIIEEKMIDYGNTNTTGNQELSETTIDIHPPSSI